jgi:hypothetical protein
VLTFPTRQKARDRNLTGTAARGKHGRIAAFMEKPTEEVPWALESAPFTQGT